MFKESFKYYKTKWPAPDMSEVVDFDAPSSKICDKSIHLTDGISECSVPGLQPSQIWRCYTLRDHPGIIVVRNPFTTQGQRYWMARCLRDYPRHPNANNLNARLFADAVRADWWNALSQETDKDETRRMKISMRWATLGYHHNWDTKIYSDDHRHEFPHDLAELSEFCAHILGFLRFRAEAAIVNYYPIGTTLAGHTDHSEQNLEAPLFSFSFGQSAIFLIGGQTKEEKPTALLLNSGDILIMSRESRICYHAVPRVMKSRNETWNNCIPSERANSLEPPNLKKLKTDCVLKGVKGGLDAVLYHNVACEEFWMPFKAYLSDSRININVRQVLNEGDISLS